MALCKFKSIILLAGFFLSATLFAQTRCPVGVQVGSVQCLPDDEESAPPRPTGEWIDTWGVIATASRGAGGGVSSNQLSKEDAESVALQNCRSTGAEECRVSYVYSNQCAALVSPVGRKGGFFNSGGTIKDAVSRAKSDCEKAAKGYECKVEVSECSYPIFKKY